MNTTEESGIPQISETFPQKTKRMVRDYISELRMFSRNARLYLTGIFLVWLNFQVFMLLFNLYLRELGYVDGDIGWMNSARAIGMSVMALPVAVIISRIRLKPILLIACVLLAVFSFGMTTFHSFFVIFAFSVLSGTMLAAIRVAAGPFFMRNSTSKERTLLFSAAFATHVLAGMVASASAGEMVTVFESLLGELVLSYRYTMYIGIALSLMALIPLVLIKASDPSAEENRITISRQLMRERGKFYFRLSIANFLVGMGAGLIIPFLNLYFQDRFGLPADKLGWFYFSVTFSMFLGSMIGPMLTKKLGLVRTIVVTQVLSLPFMLILSYSYVLPLVFVAFVVRAGLMNMGVPIFTNFSMELCRENEQGLVNALLMFSWTSSWAVSQAIGGTLIEAYGYTTTINITIALYVLSSFICYALFRNSERRNTDGPGYSIIHDQAA